MANCGVDGVTGKAGSCPYAHVGALAASLRYNTVADIVKDSH
jgi:hypothetical protein